MAKFDKENKNGNEKEQPEKMIEMLWEHGQVAPGSKEQLFGYDCTANEDGYFTCFIVESQVKNEMRREKRLIPIDLFRKKKALEEEANKLYE